MAEPLKNMYNRESLRKLCMDIQAIYDPFQVDAFVKSTMDETWGDLELKSRIYKISRNLGKYLPADYREAIGVIDKVVMNHGSWLDGFSDFFEIYGQDEKNCDISMDALERYTPHTHPRNLP